MLGEETQNIKTKFFITVVKLKKIKPNKKDSLFILYTFFQQGSLRIIKKNGSFVKQKNQTAEGTSLSYKKGCFYLEPCTQF